MNNSQGKAKKLLVALAGTPNVGKSVIFNYLTGLHQHVGNWPGKTVEVATGTLHYKGYDIEIVDLPGIYSLTTYSAEELVAREFLITQEPDFIINVVDATNLERNLFFTIQLSELNIPMVVSLNMANLLEEKGLQINGKKLQKLLTVPIISTEAIYGEGITEVLDAGIKLTKKKGKLRRKKIKYRKETEERISAVENVIENYTWKYPKRWISIKLLEKDTEVTELAKNINPEIISQVKEIISLMEKEYDSEIIISDERCCVVRHFIEESVKKIKPRKVSLSEKLANLTIHRIFGYPILLAVILMAFSTTFLLGKWMSSLLSIPFDWIETIYHTLLGISVYSELGWSLVEGVLALIGIGLPYITIFYFILFTLEDCGYLARIAFLLDNLMHRVGIHGKAIIPILLSYGCNVPGCLGCKIMETYKERFITAFLTTLIPCSAVTVIITGLVGNSLGIKWTLGLYVFNLIIVFILGRLTFKTLPGESTELIMEMPDYRKPHLRTILLQTWARLKEFISIASPTIIVSGIIIKVLQLTGILETLSVLLNPITVNWLGLPSITGTLLILGFMRKELILLMLAVLLGTSDFASVLTPIQMITLSIVSMFYVPCVATIAVLRREFGTKKAILIAVFEIIFAVSLAGIMARILPILFHL